MEIFAWIGAIASLMGIFILIGVLDISLDEDGLPDSGSYQPEYAILWCDGKGVCMLCGQRFSAELFNPSPASSTCDHRLKKTKENE